MSTISFNASIAWGVSVSDAYREMLKVANELQITITGEMNGSPIGRMHVARSLIIIRNQTTTIDIFSISYYHNVWIYPRKNKRRY